MGTKTFASSRRTAKFGPKYALLVIQGVFLTGAPLKVSDYIVNLIKKSSKYQDLLTGWYIEIFMGGGTS